MLRRLVDDREKCDCNVEHLQLRFATCIVHACSCWDVLIAVKSVDYLVTHEYPRGYIYADFFHPWLVGIKPTLREHM